MIKTIIMIITKKMKRNTLQRQFTFKTPGGRQAYKIHYLSRSILQRIPLHKDTRKNCICNLGCRLLRFDMAKKNKGPESNEQVLLAKTIEYLNSSSVFVTNVACSVGVLFGRVNSQKRTIVYLTQTTNSSSFSAKSAARLNKKNQWRRIILASCRKLLE